jgi:acetolactate synthase I/III small subunit
MTTPKPLRTFIAYMEDRPGVLTRIASMFRRRGYNIASLNVGRTHESGVSRLTMVAEADETTGRLMEANLYKLVDVLGVEDISDRGAVVRDLALIKIRADGAQRVQALHIAETYRASVLDVSDDTMILEIAGPQDKIMELVEKLRPFGIAEMVQTGAVAMTRGKEGAATRVAHAMTG